MSLMLLRHFLVWYKTDIQSHLSVTLLSVFIYVMSFVIYIITQMYVIHKWKMKKEGILKMNRENKS